jgi:hypothetical protein
MKNSHFSGLCQQKKNVINPENSVKVTKFSAKKFKIQISDIKVNLPPITRVQSEKQSQPLAEITRNKPLKCLAKKRETNFIVQWAVGQNYG